MIYHYIMIQVIVYLCISLHNSLSLCEAIFSALSDKIQDMKEYVENNPEYFIYASSAIFTIVVCRYIVMPWADRWQVNFERELDRRYSKFIISPNNSCII